jgi:hypothetical protein
LVGDRIGWHLDRLPALDEGVRHLLSMSERGAQGQQQRNQAASLTVVLRVEPKKSSGPGGAFKARDQFARHRPRPDRHKKAAGRLILSDLSSEVDLQIVGLPLG